MFGKLEDELIGGGAAASNKTFNSGVSFVKAKTVLQPPKNQDQSRVKMASKRFKKPVDDSDSQRKSVRFAEKVEVKEFGNEEEEEQKQQKQVSDENAVKSKPTFNVKLPQKRTFSETEAQLDNETKGEEEKDEQFD